MNHVLDKLGLGQDDRVVIIHVDDLGMNDSALAAYEEIRATGLPVSGSVMVPCPWFPKVAEYCRENPEADVGVHVTLTSEWSDYRWRPLSGIQPENGLTNVDGYFFKTVGEFAQSADKQATVDEVILQIQTALDAGVAPSHCDWHMLAITQRFDVLEGIAAYVTENKVYPMFLNWQFEQWAKVMPEDHAAYVDSVRQKLEDLGAPLVDHIEFLDLQTIDNRLEYVKNVFSKIRKGLSYVSFHPAKETADLREITPDWKARVADYEVFTNPALSSFLKDQGIIPITCRQLKEAM